MAGRVFTTVLTGAAMLLGAVGVVAVPRLLPCWLVVGAVVAGVLHGRLVERTGAVSPDVRRACRHRSVVVGAGTAVGCTVVVGLVVLFGPVSRPVVLVLLLAGAPRMWRGLRRARAWTPPLPPPVPATRPVVVAVVAPEASTAELCLAWRRSYLALLDTPAGPGPHRRPAPRSARRARPAGRRRVLPLDRHRRPGRW